MKFWELKSNPNLFTFANKNIGFVEKYSHRLPHFRELKIGDIFLLFDKNDINGGIKGFHGLAVLVAIDHSDDGAIYVKKILNLNKSISRAEAQSISTEFYTYQNMINPISNETFTNFLKVANSLDKLNLIEQASKEATLKQYDTSTYVETVQYSAPPSQQSTSVNQSNETNHNIESSHIIENIEEQNTEVHEIDQLNKDISTKLKNLGFLSNNVIFYGIPGSGKSYYIKQLLSSNNQKLNSKYYKRILFHPEYTYSDFIGQIVPTIQNNNVTYDFKNGAFTEILASALKDPLNNYFLIVEEINRGNAPAIFGDIFQLLDRSEEGESEYSIYNKDIITSPLFKSLHLEEIKIPKNLTILASMNTSDQNVFTLDTAFKRRFLMSRIKIDYNYQKYPILNEIIDGKNYNYGQFIEALNTDLLNIFKDDGFAEDKLIGNYFLKKKEIHNKAIFAQKILMYLWDDVAKFDRYRLFNSFVSTLDEAIDKFSFNKEKELFSSSCTSLLTLFDESENTNDTREETL